MSKVYSSNLTKEQWELIEPLIPRAKTGGRKREVDIWCILNAIFYVLTQGCTLCINSRMYMAKLTRRLSPWQTVYTYFRNWRQDGTWISIHDQLRDWVRVDAERAASPSEAIIDSQSVKSAAMVTEEVGYDAGKKIKGRKRFMTVDTLGLVLRVLVTSAKMPERAGAKQALKRVKDMKLRFLD